MRKPALRMATAAVARRAGHGEPRVGGASRPRGFEDRLARAKGRRVTSRRVWISRGRARGGSVDLAATVRQRRRRALAHGGRVALIYAPVAYGALALARRAQSGRYST